MSNETGKNRFLTDAVILALLTAYSYAAAFCYEWGYTRYFELPSSMIKVSLDLCLRSAVLLLGLLIVIIPGVLSLTGYLSASLEKPAETTPEKLGIAFFVLMVAWGIVTPVLGLPLLLCLLPPIAPLILAVFLLHAKLRPIPRGGFINTVIAQVRKQNPVVGFRVFKQFIGTDNLLVFGIALCVLIFAGVVGYSRAANTTFFIATKSGDKVLLLNDADLYVFANLDRETGTIGNEVFLLRPEDVAKLNLKRIQINKPKIRADEADNTAK